MIQVKAISGDMEYVESELSTLLDEGWEVIDLTTNLYSSTGGMRKETTVYLKTNVQA